MPVVDPVCAEPKIFVGGLKFELTRDDVYQHFQQYGYVRSCVLLKHADTGRSKGCAMVLYTTWADAEKAVEAEAVNGTSDLSGPRQLTVKFADPQKRPEDGVLVGVTPKKLFIGQVLCRVSLSACDSSLVPSSPVDRPWYLRSVSGASVCVHVAFSWVLCVVDVLYPGLQPHGIL